MATCRKQTKTAFTYIFKNGLHEGNCNLGLLDKVVLCVLNVEPCLLLPSRTCGLETRRKSACQSTGRSIGHDALRLFGCIKFESASPHGLTGLHGDIDRGRQCRLPRLQIVPLNRIVLFDARGSDGLPCTRIQAKRPPELIVVASWRGLEHRGRVRRGTTERMR